MASHILVKDLKKDFNALYFSTYSVNHSETNNEKLFLE